MSRELLQQALDALQWHYDRGYPDSPTDEPRKRDARAIRAIRDHLAAPQPEPVTFEQAWATYEAKGYQYGKDALEQVRFGWEIAHEFALAAPPAAPADMVMVPRDLLRRLIAEALTFDPTLQDKEAIAQAKQLAAAPAPAVPRKMDIPPPGVDALDVVYAEGWNAACDAFFGGLPPQPALVVEVPAAPAVREPQDERIRWRDAVIKEAESALRTAEQEFADMPTWANVGHAAKKVTHALAVIAGYGIGGGGK